VALLMTTDETIEFCPKCGNLLWFSGQPEYSDKKTMVIRVICSGCDFAYQEEYQFVRNIFQETTGIN
jgi:DNA-directed RNA polymerase subunit M/transcription elongation factor TFIIS